MAQKILGIDVGTYSVKAVRLKSKLSGSYEFLDSFYEPVELNGEDRDKSVLDAIMRIIDANDLADDLIVTAVPGDKVTSRFLKLPFADRRKLDQVISFEVENHVPFSAYEIVADYQLLSKDKEGADVFAQVAKKSDVASILGLFSGAGLGVKYLDSEVMTLFSAIMSGEEAREKTAIIDIGHKKTLFTVVKDKKVAYSRSIDFGGAVINDMISGALNVSHKEADDMKRSLSVPPEVDEIIKSALKEFSDTLKRDIVSFEMAYDDELSEILLTGGMSNLSGIDEYLEELLQVRLKKLSLNDLVPKGSRKISDSSSIIAYGIALRSKNSYSMSTIDFRTDKSTSIDELKFIFKSLVKAFVMVLVLLSFYGADLYLKKRAKVETLRRLEARIKVSFNEALPKVPSRGNELTLIKEKIREAEVRADKVGGVLTKGVTTLDMLRELSVKINEAGNGEEVEIYECTFDGKRLNILGETKSYNLTDKIKKTLETSDMFKEVNMEYARFTADQKKVKFSMKIALEKKVEK
jgi:type IV pilus assembly protein PilM